MKTYTFHIHGMHCKSCVLLTESKISELPYIQKVKSSLKDHSIEVTGDFGDMDEIKIAEQLTTQINTHGYTVSVEKQIKEKNWSSFKIAIPIAILFAVLFILLQKMGIVNLIGGGSVNYGTAFVIGIIASLSTCMAVVGGLVLSMSATFAKEEEIEGKQSDKKRKMKPQLMFHIGRIVSFFILGGIIGTIGSAFTLNTTGTFVLGIIIALVMLVLGINLLDIFPWAKKLQPGMPKFISKHAHSISNFKHTITPLLIGIATFFLPCGFTQSMQIYTLTTGSFLKGGLTMLSFALGTLPVLALISFSSFNMKRGNKSEIFFKTAGLIVILFAIFNLINSLVIIGIIPPVFNF